jgi:DNA-binding MarR family transcriptional regulator
MANIRMPDDFYEQTPDASVLATEAVMNTIRTADLLFDRIGRLLRHGGPMSPSALSERLIVTRATVTGVIDSLERRGFVRRSAHPSDRRSLVVEITPAGLDVLQRLRTIVHRNEKAWLSGLSDDELLGYIEQLHRIQERLSAISEED